MSLEGYARGRLFRDLVGFHKNGLRDMLKTLAMSHELDGMEGGRLYFVPDGTRLRRQVVDGDYLTTLELWEIEDTSSVSLKKLKRIMLFAFELFDLSDVFTELWVCDRYGLSRRNVYDFRDYWDYDYVVDGTKCEWFLEGEWMNHKPADMAVT